MYKWSYLDSLGFGLRGPFEQAGTPWLVPSLPAFQTKALFAPTGPLFAVITGTAGDDILDGTAFGDTINGLAGDDTINGLGGDDTLNGGDGDDIINGGTGNDDLTGGAGADALNGGGGRDRVFYSSATASVTVDLSDLSLNSGDAAGDTYSNIEHFFGSQFDDVFTGQIGGGDVLFSGLGGDDILTGGNGADTLIGGAGDDTLINSLGLDTFIGGAGSDTFVILVTQFFQVGVTISDYTPGVDTISFINIAHTANDLNITQDGADVRISIATTFDPGFLDFGLEEYFYNFETVILTNTLVGDIDFGDFVFNNDPALMLTNGDDVLALPRDSTIVSPVTVYALAGDDTIVLGTSSDHIFGGDGNDEFLTTSSFTGLQTEATFFIFNGGQNNALFGGAGDDIFHGPAFWRGTLDGGDGFDTVTFAFMPDQFGLSVFIDTSIVFDFANPDTANIEHVIGSINGDVITGDERDNVIDGNGGGNYVRLGEQDILRGNGGNDTITSSVFAHFYGGTGDDVMTADAHGQFYIEANAGNDTIIGFELTNPTSGIRLIPLNKIIYTNGPSSFADLTLTQVGGDTVITSVNGTLTIVGIAVADLNTSFFEFVSSATGQILTQGRDAYIGTANADHVSGLGGNDIMRGFGGNDILNGNEGDDTINGGDGDDILNGNEGDDTINGGDGDDTLNGDDGSDTLDGDAGTDTIYGRGGNDLLFGGDGDDALFGGDDLDSLEGGAGADALDGGAGFDRAVYRGATGAVTVDLTNVANNTGDAAGDTYVSIEMVLGSHFNDSLTGSNAGQRLSGQGGDDLLIGLGGNDILVWRRQ